MASPVLWDALVSSFQDAIRRLDILHTRVADLALLDAVVAAGIAGIADAAQAKLTSLTDVPRSAGPQEAAHIAAFRLSRISLDVDIVVRDLVEATQTCDILVRLI